MTPDEASEATRLRRALIIHHDDNVANLIGAAHRGEAVACTVPGLDNENPEANLAHLQPVETALDGVPSTAVSRDMALRLMRGQSVILRGRDAPAAGKAFATCGGILVAVGDVERGELVPHRVFHLGGTAANRPA